MADLVAIAMDGWFFAARRELVEREIAAMASVAPIDRIDAVLCCQARDLARAAPMGRA